MTERKSMVSERAELVALDPLEMLLDAARYAEGNGGSGSNPAWAKAARAAVAKARLVAPDQKPVAWRYRYEAWPDPDHWAATIGDPSRFNNQSQLIYEPLCLSPRPDAGWDDAVSAAAKLLEEHGYRESWIYDAIEALRHNAPPDSGAGTAKTGDELNDEARLRGIANTRRIEQAIAATPDHGGADAGVGVKPLEWTVSASGTTWAAVPPLGRYLIHGYDNPKHFIAFLEGQSDFVTGDLGTLDEAKAAAQADYERRILSALSHHPAPVDANASAEARLREYDPGFVECVATGRSCVHEAIGPNREQQCIYCGSPMYPHASDCDKQGER